MPHSFMHMLRRIEETGKQIEKQIYVSIGKIGLEAWITKEPVSFSDRFTGIYKILQEGDCWGELWDCAWMHVKAHIPEAAAGRKTVVLIDVGGEGCLFDGEGTPLQGITNVNSDFDFSLDMPGKRVLPVMEEAVSGIEINWWVEAGANDLFGKYTGRGTVHQACVAICREPYRQLYYDWAVLFSLLKELPENSARAACIRTALLDASLVFTAFTEEEAISARLLLAPELSKQGGDPSLAITAIGHAHIDLAWLWPIRETKRKGYRTFATVLANMERFPDYVFGASQPQLYQWMKEYPKLYAGIRKRIEEGRWEAQGAMWVEADVNLSGGEALVRQLLYGKHFFQTEFGVDVESLWLPDVFGYSGALPQLLKKSGVPYFLTQKLSWSEHNVFPHTTFLWEGIDGSRVLAHLPPEDTYNSPANPWGIKRLEQRNKDIGRCSEAMMLFGIGDGGGGPGEEHLERLARETNLDGLCPVRQGKSSDFFKRIATNADRLNIWHGELYLEKHQGTFTTQARNKRMNRLMERHMHAWELWASLAASTGHAYPAEALERVWKEVLLYQFHDILPGSSIKRVYEETAQAYARLEAEALAGIRGAQLAMLSASGAGRVAGADYALSSVDKSPEDALFGADNSAYAVFNPLSWARREWLRLNDYWTQVSVPAMGYSVQSDPTLIEELPACGMWACSPVAEPLLLDNGILRVVFDTDGSIRQILHRPSGCEVLAPNSSGNRLSVYSDTGDAWDFDFHYHLAKTESFQLVSSEAWIDGPMACIRQIRSYGNSTLTQEISLMAGDSLLRFQTKVDWQESGKMLRVAFPTSVQAESATCSIQFGAVKRPAHSNTSWDAAQVEVPVQKWADFSRPDFGVALLNDCKYGYRLKNGVLDLNLLRSTSNPGIEADRGTHEFVYALYPHAGDEIAGAVELRAQELNAPLDVVKLENITLQQEMSGFRITGGTVILETVKQAEDGQGLILRLYEYAGQQSEAVLHLPTHAEGNTNPLFAQTQLQETNLMEQSLPDTAVISGQECRYHLTFNRFEIRTFRLLFGFDERMLIQI